MLPDRQRQRLRKLAQLGRGHGAQLLENHVHQNVAAIKKYALVQRGGLIGNRFFQHLRQLVVGEGSVSAAGVSETRGFESKLAASSRAYVADSKSVNPYSFNNAAFAGSANPGSLLICGEPESCHPENCGGRSVCARRSRGGSATGRKGSGRQHNKHGNNFKSFHTLELYADGLTTALLIRLQTGRESFGLCKAGPSVNSRL